MRLYHGTSRINAGQIVAAGISEDECRKLFTTFDLREARDLYAPFAPDGSPREAAVVQIDVDDKLVEELIDQTRAKRVEWGFYHWIVLNRRLSRVSILERHSLSSQSRRIIHEPPP